MRGSNINVLLLYAPAFTVHLLMARPVWTGGRYIADIHQRLIPPSSSLFFWLLPIIAMFFAFILLLRWRLSTADHRLSAVRNKLDGCKYSILALQHFMILQWNSSDRVRSLQEALDTITEFCVVHFNCSRTSLLIYAADSDELLLCSVRGNAYGCEDTIYTRIGMDDSVAGWVARHRQPIILGGKDDEKKYTGISLYNPYIKSSMIVPIILDDLLIGVLNVSSFQKDILYSLFDLKELSSIARVISLFIVHSSSSSNCDPLKWVNPMKSGKNTGNIRDRVSEPSAFGNKND